MALREKKMSFLTSFVNGLSLGSIYAIIALGYTMVYGIAKMLNFAHGDFIMVGSYIIFTFVSTLGLHPAVGVLVSIVLCTLLGVGTERIAYRPLRQAASPLAVLITAIGVSYLLENLALLIFGADTKSFTSIIPWSGITLAGGALRIQGVTIVTIALSVAILIALQFFVHRTKSGQAMLAVAQDKGAATLMGIDVNKTISLTFAIGSALAAVAGALLCSAYPSLTPYTGAMPGIKAFVAAVLGGIGSIPGAMIGGLVLGIVEILSRTYISSQLSDAIVFGILVVVLLVKPTGLLGKITQEKV
jgi:branched-chain amino acid transport system permease protein